MLGRHRAGFVREQGKPGLDIVLPGCHDKLENSPAAFFVQRWRGD